MSLPRQWHHHPYGVVSDALVTHLDGLNLLALLRGDMGPRTFLDGISETNPPDKPVVDSTRAWAAGTDGRWKYIWYPEGENEQLFDLKTDPREETNLADSPRLSHEKQRMIDALLEIHRRPEYQKQGLIEHGRLAGRPIQNDTPRGRRSRSWSALCTGLSANDIKH